MAPYTEFGHLLTTYLLRHSSHDGSRPLIISGVLSCQIKYVSCQPKLVSSSCSRDMLSWNVNLKNIHLNYNGTSQTCPIVHAPMAYLLAHRSHPVASDSLEFLASDGIHILRSRDPLSLIYNWGYILNWKQETTKTKTTLIKLSGTWQSQHLNIHTNYLKNGIKSTNMGYNNIPMIS